jgi:hypothetical protein
MILETKLTFSQYLKLMFTMTYRKPITVLLSLCGLTMFIGSVLYFLNFTMPVDKIPYFQLIFGFSIVALLPFSIYRSARKNYSTHGRLQERIIYNLTEERIAITGETFSSELSWEKTYKIEEFKNWILIYQNSNIANIIPKTAFGENLTEFKVWIKRKTFIKNNFSPVKKSLRTILMFLPFLPFLFVGVILIFSRAKPELYLVPENFKGEIIVLFDQPDGESMKYLDGKRIYNIPQSGVLFTQFPWNPGSKNRKFCYSINGNMKTIEETKQTALSKKETIDSNFVSVIDKGPYFYEDTIPKKYVFRAQRFIISDMKDLNKYSVDAKLDSIIEADFY